MTQRLFTNEKENEANTLVGEPQQSVEVDISNVSSILERYNCDQGMLISILQDIQDEYNYLPKETLIHVAEKLGIPQIQVYRVATFFKAFSLKPRGKHIVSVCLGTACHVRNAVRVKEKIERELGIKAGDTTDDLNFTLETVNCLGACALGPIMVVDGDYHGQMNTVKVDKVLSRYRAKPGSE
jgi:NADH:ubiquinone oxidoreductase subunit E